MCLASCQERWVFVICMSIADLCSAGLYSQLSDSQQGLVPISFWSRGRSWAEPPEHQNCLESVVNHQPINP